MSQNTQLEYMIVLIMLVIGFVYIVLMVYSLYRMKEVFMYYSRAKFNGKVLYLFIFLFCSVEVTFSVLNNYYNIKGLMDNEPGTVQPNNLLLNSRYIPDSLAIVFYFSLYWQYLILLFTCHQVHGNLIEKDTCPPVTVKYKRVYFIVLLLYFVGQLTTVVSYNIYYQKLGEHETFSDQRIDDNFLILNAVSNLLIPLTYIITEIIIFFKFSGWLFRSQKDESSFNYFHRVWLFCSVGRSIQGVSSIMLIFYQTEIYNFLSGQTSTNDSVIIIIVSATLIICFIEVVTNIIPILMCLNVTTVNLINIKTEMVTGSAIDVLLNSNTEITKFNEMDENNRMKKNFQKKQKIQIEAADLQNYEVVPNEPMRFREKGIGRIKKIRLNNQFRFYALREMEGVFNQYQYDYCMKSITNLNDRHLKGIVRPILISNMDKQICILYQFYELSLKELLFGEQENIAEMIENQRWQSQFVTENGRLTIETKLRIAKQLADILQQLNNKEEPFVHGHLKLDNILVSDEGNLKIADYGFQEYQFFLGIMSQYEIKSAFSPPEILVEQNLQQIIPDRSSDIYSYGMILYSIFQNEIPMNKQPMSEIIQIIAEESKRPQIKQDEVMFPSQISQLVRYCWQQDQQSRSTLTFQQITEIISECIVERKKSIY